MANYKLLINGELVDGASTMEVINPATETVLALCPRADEAQMEAAIQAAKAAFPAWSRRPIAQRREMLLKLADAMDAQQNDLARVLTQEQGKPRFLKTTRPCALSSTGYRWVWWAPSFPGISHCC